MKHILPGAFSGCSNLENITIDPQNDYYYVQNGCLIEKEEKKVKIERKPVNNDFKYVEELLRDKLDTKVKIKDRKIEIAFTNVADLNRILEVLNVRE